MAQPRETNNPSFSTLVPQWELAPGVKAVVTQRHDGSSSQPFNSFNLGDHVGDIPERVAENRQRLVSQLQLPYSPTWLRQTHGNNVVDAGRVECDTEADAIFAAKPGLICAVLTADCLPILLASDDGLEIAAIHAGWKGLLAEVIAAAIGKFRAPKHKISAWLGPCISKRHYQVGPELRDKFILADRAYASAFEELNSRLYMALADVASVQLENIGVREIVNCKICTFQRSDEFYSYRRDGVTGRFASLIWRE